MTDRPEQSPYPQPDDTGHLQSGFTPYPAYSPADPAAYAQPDPAAFAHTDYSAYPATGSDPADRLMPAHAAAPRRSHQRALAIGAASVVALGAVGGGAFLAGRDMALHGNGSVAAQSVNLPPPASNGTDGTGSGSGSGSSGSGSSGSGSGSYPGGSGSGGYPGGSGSSGSGTGATATAAQTVGVVDINTDLKYQGAQAAGTGMVLTSSGEILTNNHVVNGATSISVTVISTGAKYTASVVGTAPTQDVAVLQLQNASGLQTIKLGESNSVAVGDAVTGVGNAGGVGGAPSAAAGTVTALDQPITAADETGQNVQHLTGMIETDAAIQAGDSGGPLYDASNEVIGMDSAASAGATGTQAYAIPIDHALQIAQQIESGSASSTVHIGLPAFLGVSIAASAVQGATVQSTLDGGPAAGAGITAGDVITSVGGTAINSGSDLQAALRNYQPGQSVTVTWSDQAGQSHTAKVTLGTGPAD